MRTVQDAIKDLWSVAGEIGNTAEVLGDKLEGPQLAHIYMELSSVLDLIEEYGMAPEFEEFEEYVEPEAQEEITNGN